MSKKEVCINVSNLSPFEKQQCVRFLNEKHVTFSKSSEEQYLAKIIISEPKNILTENNSNGRNSNKKPIGECVDCKHYTKLAQLSRWLQVYIYPKKLSLKALIEYSQGILDAYFKTKGIKQFIKENKSPESYQSFPDFVYNDIVKRQKTKSKTQQFLVNLLESVNHFKTKCKGIKIFHSFLTQNYKIEEILFLYFLRKMIESIKTLKIYEKDKVRNDLNTLVIQEEYVWVILSNLCNSAEREEIEFKKIKEHMRFDNKIKKNITYANDFLDVLLVNFKNFDNKQISQANSVTNSEVGEERLQQGDHQPKINQQEQKQQSKKQERFTSEQNILFLACLEGLKKLCDRVCSPLQFYDRFAILVSSLLESIFLGDKMLWFNTIRIQPTDSKLHYIESLQRQYEALKKCEYKPAITSRFVKRILQAPGFHEEYLKHMMQL